MTCAYVFSCRAPVNILSVWIVPGAIQSVTCEFLFGLKLVA